MQVAHPEHSRRLVEFRAVALPELDPAVKGGPQEFEFAASHSPVLDPEVVFKDRDGGPQIVFVFRRRLFNPHPHPPQAQDVPRGVARGQGQIYCRLNHL
jgi:hypothetical protein